MYASYQSFPLGYKFIVSKRLMGLDCPIDYLPDKPKFGLCSEAMYMQLRLLSLILK